MSKQTPSNQSPASQVAAWPVPAPAAVGVAIIAQRSLGRDHVGERYEGVRIGGDAVELLLVHPLASYSETHSLSEALHPEVEQVLEALETPQGLWLVRLPDGAKPWLVSLRERKGQGESSALKRTLSLGKALSALHAAGRVHGALYADTLRVQDNGQWLVRSPWGFDLTAIPRGEVKAIRSPMLAPEVAFEGERPSLHSDIFSLGCLLGAELAGGLTEPSLSLREQGIDVSAELDAIYLQATATEATARYPSVSAFCEALRAVLGEASEEALVALEQEGAAPAQDESALASEDASSSVSEARAELLPKEEPSHMPVALELALEEEQAPGAPTVDIASAAPEDAASESLQSQPKGGLNELSVSDEVESSSSEDVLAETDSVLSEALKAAELSLETRESESLFHGAEQLSSSGPVVNATGATGTAPSEATSPEWRFEIPEELAEEAAPELKPAEGATHARLDQIPSELDEALSKALDEAEALDSESTWVEDIASLSAFQGLELQDVAPKSESSVPESASSTSESEHAELSRASSEDDEVELALGPEPTLLDLPEPPSLELLTDHQSAFEPIELPQASVELEALSALDVPSTKVTRPPTGRVNLPRPAVFTAPPPEDPLLSKPVEGVIGGSKSRRTTRPAFEAGGELKDETTLSLSRRSRRPANATQVLAAAPSLEGTELAGKGDQTDPDLPPVPTEFLNASKTQVLDESSLAGAKLQASQPSLTGGAKTQVIELPPASPKRKPAATQMLSSREVLKASEEEFEADLEAESTLVEGIAPALLDMDVLGIELSKVKEKPQETLKPAFVESEDTYQSPFLVKPPPADSLPSNGDLPEIPDAQALELIKRPPPSLKSLQTAPPPPELTLGGYPVGSNPYARPPDRSSKLWLWVGLGVAALVVLFLLWPKGEPTPAHDATATMAQQAKPTASDAPSKTNDGALGVKDEAPVKAADAPKKEEAPASPSGEVPSQAGETAKGDSGSPTQVAEDENEVLELEPEEAATELSPAQAQAALTIVSDPDSLRCPDGMLKLKRKRQVKDAAGASHDTWDVHCMDRFEYPGAGATPKTNIDLAGAKAACAARGKRLCTRSEWRRGCGSTYPYGRTFEEGRCATAGLDGSAGSIVGAGSKAGCRSPSGAMDMVGNVAEWTSDGFINGGAAARNSDDATCSMSSKRAGGAPHIGFRCCADAK